MLVRMESRNFPIKKNFRVNLYLQNPKAEKRDDAWAALQILQVLAPLATYAWTVMLSRLIL